jgi:hypothetical protein
MPKIQTVAEIREVLRSADFDALIGTVESVQVEAKGEPYQLSSGDRQKQELAKDVSAVFSQQIQPLLADIPTAAIRSRIGVSRWYAGKIRHGYRPHPRHWQALAELVSVSSNAS